MPGEKIVFCREAYEVLEVEFSSLTREDLTQGEQKRICVELKGSGVTAVSTIQIDGLHFADLASSADNGETAPALRLIYAYLAKRLNDNNNSPRIRFRKLQLVKAVLDYLRNSVRENNPLQSQQSWLGFCHDEFAQAGELKKCLQAIDRILGAEFLRDAGDYAVIADAGLLRNKRLRLFTSDNDNAYLVFDRGDECFSQLQILSLKKEWFAKANPQSADPVKNLLMAYVYDVLKNEEHAELGFFGNYEKRMADLRQVAEWLTIIEAGKTLTIGLFNCRGKIAKLVESLRTHESSAELAAR